MSSPATASNKYAHGNDGDDTLNGGIGADTIIGGTGSDIYVVDNASDVVTEEWDGTDTVQSTLTYTLGTNVENLTLLGAATINGTGNSLNNISLATGLPTRSPATMATTR